MKYSDLGLEITSTVKQVKLGNGVVINVKQYLPISDKISLINIALENSICGDGYYDPVLLEMLFNVYVVFTYSDLEFTDEEKGEIGKIYDEMLSNGYIDRILNAIPENEYNELLGYLEEKRAAAERYKGSLADAIQNLMTNLPKNAEAAQKIIDEFDENKYANVINFAKAVNNGKLPE